jgi:hypothetical protein
MAIAEDIARFVPELTPLVASALAAGREALYKPDGGDEDEAQATDKE